MTNDNGTLTRDTAEHIADVALRVFANSITADRRELANRLGITFDGSRDLFAELGYKKSLTFDDYRDRYDREGLSARIVDKPAIDSWQSQPIIKDGDRSSGTRFTDDLKQLNKRVKLWANLAMLDKISGIGHYGTMVIGSDGDWQTPLDGRANINFLIPLDEGESDVVATDSNKSSPRYTKPQIYEVSMIDGDPLDRIHWSRVWHVAENSRRGVYGIPRLRKSFNRLQDLDKLVGGSAEAAWRMVYKGIVLSEKEGYDLKKTTAELEDVTLKFIHNLKRVLIASGFDVNEIGNTEIPQPKELFDVLISLIAADIDMPQRILIGSERGELASSTDQASWAAAIDARREQHVTPNIVRRAVDWLIMHSVISQPSAGEYAVEWEPIYRPSIEQIANINEKRAKTLAAAINSGAVVEGYADINELRELAGFEPRNDAQADRLLDIEDELGDD